MQRANPRSKASAKTSHENARELLLAAAQKLFALRGLDGVTVREIADEAGVNLSLVSYHFNGKEGLYRATLESFGKARLAMAQRLLQAPRSPEELRVRLRMFAEELVQSHIEQPDLGRMIFRECEMNMTIAEDIFRETFLKVFATCAEFLASAQRARLIRAELDPVVAAGIFFGSLAHQMRMNSISERFFKFSLSDAKFRREFIDHLMKIFLDGAVRGPARTGSRQKGE